GAVDRVQDVHDEYERVGALDPGRRLAGRPVAVLRRNDQHHPAAHRQAEQALVPAGDDLLWRRADLEAERRAPGPGGVEDGAGPPVQADVLGDDFLALGHRGPG